MSDWERAAQALEATIEASARILDGESDVTLPQVPRLDLSSAPDAATVARIRSLISDAQAAENAMAQRRAEILQDLEQSDRLRQAGRQYLRF